MKKQKKSKAALISIIISTIIGLIISLIIFNSSPQTDNIPLGRKTLGVAVITFSISVLIAIFLSLFISSYHLSKKYVTKRTNEYINTIRSENLGEILPEYEYKTETFPCNYLNPSDSGMPENNKFSMYLGYISNGKVHISDYYKEHDEGPDDSNTYHEYITYAIQIPPDCPLYGKKSPSKVTCKLKFRHARVRSTPDVLSEFQVNFAGIKTTEHKDGKVMKFLRKLAKEPEAKPYYTYEYLIDCSFTSLNGIEGTIIINFEGYEHVAYTPEHARIMAEIFLLDQNFRFYADKECINFCTESYHGGNPDYNDETDYFINNYDIVRLVSRKMEELISVK